MSKIDAIQATTIASYSASCTGLAFGLSANQVVAAVSICFIILTYVTSFYFQRKKDKREIEIMNNKKLSE